MKPRTLRELQALEQLGFVVSSELPEVGTDLMMKGEENEAIVLLAGLGREPNTFEATELLRKALKEAQLRPLADVDAAMIAAQRVAAAIVEGAVPPEEGARWIWFEVWSQYGHPDLLTDFVALADEFDELGPQAPEGRQAILEQEIRSAAAELVSASVEGPAA